ncbi:MAG: BlaI/MecI/CopY family transcriptional regulator [Bacteroidetes bacterium]|nr:BlaI/MecI/CopY family transcriptional regulator [Bacteroidota bacterium]
MPNSYQPSDSELDILRVLWNSQPLSVRQVHEQLAKEKDVGYTTTLKQMQRMLEKGVLERRAEGRTHLYSTPLQAPKVQRSMLGRLLDKAFGGSSFDLVMQALGQSEPSEEELDRLEQFVQEKKKQKRHDKDTDG